MQQSKASNQHNILIQYLDEFGKQISTRKNNNGLEEQLSSLSKAYNLAQEKLLETEKALMNETILAEKQRSIIEFYKYILREDMEDEGILTFIQHLEDQQQERREIYEQLTELKALLNRKKLKSCKKSLSGSKNVRQLKNEVQRLQSQQRSLSEESIFISSENEQLKDKVNDLTEQIVKCRQQTQILSTQLGNKNIELAKCEAMLSMQKEENTVKNEKIVELTVLQQKYNSLAIDNQKMLQIIQTRLNISNDRFSSKENNLSFANNEPLSNKYVRQFDEKLSQLEKYKLQYKKMKENYRECELHKRQISLLKLFISEEALLLFKEYQEHTLDCLETELRNLAVLEKNKLMRLQQCQREIWKYRIQLMKQQDQNGMANSYQQNRMNFTKQATSNNFKILSTGPPMISSVTANANNVSQFDVNP